MSTNQYEDYVRLYTSSTSDSFRYEPPLEDGPKVEILKYREPKMEEAELKIDFEAIKEELTGELKTIAKEQEEDKEKHLPVFNPEDLDL